MHVSILVLLNIYIPIIILWSVSYTHLSDAISTEVAPMDTPAR